MTREKIQVKNKKETKKVNKIKNRKIKIENNDKNSFNTLEVVSLIIITAIVGLIAGILINKGLSKNKLSTEDKELKKFIKNYNYIVDNYYEDIDKKELLNNAIKGMLDSLEDDYSYLLDEDSSESFNIQLEGEYEGIGIEIVLLNSGDIVVYDVFENSPADKAGLKIGDIIKTIDNKEFSTPTELSKYIRDNKKDTFAIKIKRDDKEKTLELKKESVTIKAVNSKTYNKDNKKIGYINMSIFSNIAYKQFKEELTKLEKENIDALIIDVRDNNGGHLSTATNIISLFLDSNHIIYQTETKASIKKYYSTGSKTKKYKIIVLQNENSASASEMLSAALKEEYGATVIGKTSFGKGTVQELLTLDDGVEYKITTKQWLTPKGNSINKKGVSVNIDVTLDDKYYEDPKEENDNQLQKALEEAIK